MKWKRTIQGFSIDRVFVLISQNPDNISRAFAAHGCNMDWQEVLPVPHISTVNLISSSVTKSKRHQRLHGRRDAVTLSSHDVELKWKTSNNSQILDGTSNINKCLFG